MSYIDEIADSIRRGVPSHLLPQGDTAALFRLYAVLAMTKGDKVVLHDVHDAWAAWMSEQNPKHKSLKPLELLPDGIRLADRPYLKAIHAVARDRHLGRCC